MTRSSATTLGLDPFPAPSTPGATGSIIVDSVGEGGHPERSFVFRAARQPRVMAQALTAVHLHTAPLTFPTLEAELLRRGHFTAGHVQQMFVYGSFSLFELRQVALRNLERINASLAEDRRRDLFGGWDTEDSE